VFSEIGATVIPIGVQPNGLNINEGVGATKPDTLQKAVLAEQADLGIALDGDGDRLIMVDHRGEIVDGDELLFIIARSRFRQDRLQAPVIGTLMSNLGLEHALSALGLQFKRAAVGDRYVLEMMEENASTIGGEGSGHIICLDRSTTGDGIIAALQVLAEMHMRQARLYDLKSGMTKYPQCLVNVKIRESLDLNTNQSILQAKKDVEQQLGGTGRVLLRSSGTEPLVRVMVEGRDAELVHTLANRLADDVRKALAA
jgi:phosphoglucosamine mutase